MELTHMKTQPSDTDVALPPVLFGSPVQAEVLK